MSIGPYPHVTITAGVDPANAKHGEVIGHFPAGVAKRSARVDFTHEGVDFSNIAPFGPHPIHLHIEASLYGVTRREASRTVVEPDPAKVAEYKRLRAMLDEIEASDLWCDTYDGGYLDEPTPTTEIEYAETHDEFVGRVNAARTEAAARAVNHFAPPAFRGPIPNFLVGPDGNVTTPGVRHHTSTTREATS